MFIELEPLFNNVAFCVPIDYSMDMSDESFYAGKPFEKAIKISGEVKNRAGIVSVEAVAEVRLTEMCRLG